MESESATADKIQTSLIIPQLERIPFREEIRQAFPTVRVPLMVIFAAAAFFTVFGGYLAILWAIVGAGVLLYGAIEKAERERLMRSFAKLNGFTFSPETDLESFSGDFFNQGHTQEVSHVITGTLGPHPIRFFTFRFITGSGKRKRIHYNAGVEAALDVSLPLLIVTPNTWSDYEPSANLETVSLEGNFSEHFHVWTEHGRQREAREVLTPDEMAYLIDNAKSYTIELHRDKLYLFKRNDPINTPEELRHIVAIVDYLLSEWSPVIKRILN